MQEEQIVAPESSAVRVALWRALHVQIDPPPHVLEDQIGLKLVAPEDGWRNRPDMDPEATSPFRTSIVIRARFIEDLLVDAIGRGIAQDVLLGAGLDTFAQRRPEIASGLRIYEVDKPGPQAWKRQRLIELGFGIPEWLRLVPVDFEAGDSWWERLTASDFDASQPAVVASAGVSMYLTRDAIAAMLRQIAGLSPGSVLAMTFIPPLESAKPQECSGRLAAEKGAKASGTPFLSFFTPSEMLELAREAGLTKIQHISGATLARRYFARESDGPQLASSEEMLIATTG